MKVFSFVIILVFSAFTFAQKPENFACSKDDKRKVREYFEKIDEFHKIQTDCRNSYNESGELWKFNFAHFSCEWSNNGCPVSLVLPKISDSINLQLFGTVKVEIFADKKGNVIYARTLNGHPFLRKSAGESACKSQFSPKSFCGKSVMQKRFIHYNFGNI